MFFFSEGIVHFYFLERLSSFVFQQSTPLKIILRVLFDFISWTSHQVLLFQQSLLLSFNGDGSSGAATFQQRECNADSDHPTPSSTTLRHRCFILFVHVNNSDDSRCVLNSCCANEEATRLTSSAGLSVLPDYHERRHFGCNASLGIVFILRSRTRSNRSFVFLSTQTNNGYVYA